MTGVPLTAAPYSELQQLGEAVLTWVGVGLAVLAGWILLLLARTMRRLPDAVDRMERMLDQLAREAEAMEGLGVQMRQAGTRLGDAAGDLARVTGAAADTTRKIQQRLADPVIEGTAELGQRVLLRARVLGAGLGAAGRALWVKAMEEPRPPAGGATTAPTLEGPESGRQPRQQ